MISEILLNHAATPEGSKLCYELGGEHQRVLLESLGWKYVSLAINPEGSQTTLSHDPYAEWGIRPAPLVVCCSGFGDVAYPWLWIQRVRLIIEPGGKTVLSVPRRANNCWAAGVPGLEALCSWAELEVILRSEGESSSLVLVRRPILG